MSLVPETPSTPKRQARATGSGATTVETTPSRRGTTLLTFFQISARLIILCYAASRAPSTRATVKDITRVAYSAVHKATGTLGGNGYQGAIYGELTISSMQKVDDRCCCVMWVLNACDFVSAVDHRHPEV